MQESKDKLSLKNKNLSIAYIIPSLPFGIKLAVKKSANAWWMDQSKVHELFAGFSIGLKIEEACSHIGITVRQYKYFVQLHPQVTEIRKGFTLSPSIKARMTIISALNKGNLKVSKWWLEKKNPEEFGKPSVRNGRLAKRQQTQQAALDQLEGPKSPDVEEAMAKFREALKQARKNPKKSIVEPITVKVTDKPVAISTPTFPKITESEVPFVIPMALRHLPKTMQTGEVEYSDPEFDLEIEKLQALKLNQKEYKKKYLEKLTEFFENKQRKKFRSNSGF